MNKSIRNQHLYLFLCILLHFILASCSKDKNLDNEQDQYIEQEEKLTNLTLSVSAVGKNFIEFSWDKISSSHFNPVSYMVYMDGKLVAKDINITKYSVINLDQGKNYDIKVQAISTSGVKVEHTLQGTTLGLNNDDNNNYKEYKIHTQSTLVNPSKVRLLNDGGHLICSFIQHENFSNQDNYKLIVYRTDNKGNILWYRLIANLDYFSNPLQLLLPTKNNEAFLLVSRHLYTIDFNKGTLINDKPIVIENIGTEDYITAAQLDSQGGLIIGTARGNLLKVDMTTYKGSWNHKNSDYPINTIQLDKTNQIYYSVTNLTKSEIQVQKTDQDGKVIANFKFDGKYPGETYDQLYRLPILIKDKDDNFYLWGCDVYSYLLRYFKFDKNGKVLSKTKEAVNFQPTGAFVDNENNIVVYGQEEGGGISTYGTIKKYDKNLNVLSSTQYPELQMHRFTDITQNKDNSYNLFFYYQQTFSYSNFNFIYIKTKSNGQLK